MFGAHHEQARFHKDLCIPAVTVLNTTEFDPPSPGPLKPGELLTGEVNGEFYSRMWPMARADSFEPNEVSAA